MKACGLIVEYNPLHNGHIHHIQESRKKSNAECMIAIMSGPFLQRGEPAIVDKFHRAESALHSGVDIVLELPYPYAVQSSNLFAKGAVQSLQEIGVSSICFGSESGNITDFISSYQQFSANEELYSNALKKHLKLGVSYPKANEFVQKELGLNTIGIDLSQPNNILGYSYVREILTNNLPIQPLTINRSSSGFHEQQITSSIASATSIRNQLFKMNSISAEIAQTIPDETKKQLNLYKNKTTTWHTWESYFSLIHYRVMSMTLKELEAIHGVDEGLEYRIKETAPKATSFKNWINEIKTKRYTWTRLQRMFVHILTNTKKINIRMINETTSVPYIRLLGLTKTGRSYLNTYKKDVSVPIVTQLSRNTKQMLAMDERASSIYYSILPPQQQIQLRRQEMEPPIII